MEKEENWIFTFGCGQVNKGHFVRIHGTFSEARRKMYEKYGDKWSFQYSEKEWEDWCKNAPKYIPRETEMYVEGLSCKMEKEE